MSYQRQAPTLAGGATSGRIDQASGAGASQSGQQARASTPNRLLDELLALGTGHIDHFQPQQNLSNANHENQSNITIIDYRPGAAGGPVPFPFGGELGAARPERRSTFDQFASQFKSSLGLGDKRRPTKPPPPPVEVSPLLAAGNVKILDIRRTKTNRKRPKTGETSGLAHLVAHEEDEDDEDCGGGGDCDGSAVEGQHQEQSSRSRNQTSAKHQQQQRQQSGETLSSFESDYDLLVYLGETETEDLVETERSLDYLDQTWRQSICGGASLAPTIDESLSELLAPSGNQQVQQRFGSQLAQARTPVDYNDEFDLLWSGGQGASSVESGTLNSAQRRRHDAAASVANHPAGRETNLLSDLSYGGAQSFGWSASLPRERHYRGPHQTGGTLVPAESAVRNVAGRADNQQNQGGRSTADPSSSRPDTAANLGSKFNSLFGRSARQQQPPQAPAQSDQRQLASSPAMSSSQMAPQKPRRQQYVTERPASGGSDENADELDRLLAEMSQSLDLDSLARYDPYRGRPAQPQQQQRQPQPQQPSNRNNYQTTSQLPVRSAQKGLEKTSKVATATSSQPRTDVQTANRNESILEDYDGASRMLEQMISDQLDEALSGDSRPKERHYQPADPQQTKRDSPGKVHKFAQPTTKQSFSWQASQRDHSSQATSDEERASASSASQTRKISSTCSSLTTEVSVVPSSSRPGAMAGRQQLFKHKNKLESQTDVASGASRKSRPLKHQTSLAGPPVDSQRRRPLNHSRSLDVPTGALPSPNRNNDHSGESTNNSKEASLACDLQRPSPARSVTSARKVSPDLPPVDFGDHPHGNNLKAEPIETIRQPEVTDDEQVIRVEASELPSPTSSEDESNSKRVMDKVRKRTLSGVRNMRDRFSRHFSNSAEANADLSAPEPPKRSSSITKSRESRERLNQVPEANVAPRPEPADSARQSRGRERRGAKPAQDGDEEKNQQAETKKTFGRQLRERLSRSKSRFSQFLQRPLSLHRPQAQDESARAQSTPLYANELTGATLFEPGDIARNEPRQSTPFARPQTKDSSLERQLRADLEASPTRAEQERPKLASSARNLSQSSDRSLASGDLSGLETTTDAGRQGQRLFGRRPARSSKRKARTNQQSTGNGANQAQRRPTSLMSLKKFGEAFGARPEKAGSDEIENLEAVKVSNQRPTAKRSARNKRLRNKSTGDQVVAAEGRSSPSKLETPARTVTDDYFGLKSPLATPDDLNKSSPPHSMHQRVEIGPRVRPASVLFASPSGDEREGRRLFGKRIPPNRSQSLKSVDRPSVRQSQAQQVAELGIGAGELLTADEARQKSVSFQNLSPPTNQRRPLSPVSPNTFRPMSAGSAQEALPSASLSAPDRPTSFVETPRQSEPSPIQPIQLPTPILAGAKSPSARQGRAPVRDGPARSPIRDRSAAFIEDLRDKCGHLFRPANGRTEQAAAESPPSRPPRGRKRRLPHEEASARSKSLVAPPSVNVIEVEPASPSDSLLLGGDSPEPRQLQTSEPAKRGVKRLTNFAQQLKTSAADFFAGQPHNNGAHQARRSQSIGRPARLPQTSSTVDRRPLFRNVDEPLVQGDLAQWRPIISRGGTKTSGRVQRSSSFRLPKEQEGDSFKNRTLGDQTGGGGRKNSASKEAHDDDDDDDDDDDSTWDDASDDELSDQDRASKNLHSHEPDRPARSDPTPPRRDDSSRADKTFSEREQVARDPPSGSAPTSDAARSKAPAANPAVAPSSSTGTDKNNNANPNNTNGRTIAALQSDPLPELGRGHHLQDRLVFISPPRRSEPPEDEAPNPSSSSRDESETAVAGEDGAPSFSRKHNARPNKQTERGNSNEEPALKVQSVNERAFRFNQNLPSPSQVLSETGRGAMTATRSIAGVRGRQAGRGGGVLATNGKETRPALDGAKESSGETNRLSIYENVDPQEALAASNHLKQQQTHTKPDDQRTTTTTTTTTTPNSHDQEARAEAEEDDRPTPRPPKPELPTKPQHIVASDAMKRRESKRRDSDGQQDDWSVEPDERLVEMVSNKATAKAAEPLKTTKEQQEAPRANHRTERKLISMTSIIHEPEDDLMNLNAATVGGSPAEARQRPRPGAWTEDNRRHSNMSAFSTQNDSENDESDSSLVACGRKRLEKKLNKASAGQRPNKPPLPSRPPNLPRAGGSGSLVKRLARNFDQTVQEPAALQRKPNSSRPPAAVGRLAAGSNQPQQQQVPSTSPIKTTSSRAQELVDEPKSDSTWYDAKSIELLDEAEVAELLREFEHDGQLSGSEQYLTLSQDQPGRRDGRRSGPARSGSNQDDDDDDDDEDPTLNDDETLNDADDAEQDADLLDEDESVYASAATNQNVSLRAPGEIVEVGSRDGGSRRQAGATTSVAADRARHSPATRAAEHEGAERGRAACAGRGELDADVDCDDSDSDRAAREEAAHFSETIDERHKRTNQNAPPTRAPHLEPNQLTPPAEEQTDDRRRAAKRDMGPQLLGALAAGETRDKTDHLLAAFECAHDPTCATTPTIERELQKEEPELEQEDEASSMLGELSSERSSSCREDLISLSSSSLSSESMPELRRRKNLQRLYNIVNEICTSEQKFVETLKLLNEDFREFVLQNVQGQNADQRAEPSANNLAPPFDCVSLILKHLPQLQALNESLLHELRAARNQWPSTQKVSHVLVKIGPFLKHYSSYIRDFECIQQQFQDNLKRSSHFRELIKRFELEAAEKCGQLSVQHHLLKPIQRIPQYRLLLQQYLHHLKPDDADYEDTVSALEVVSRVAEHANQSLSEGANFAKLLALQAKIVGGKQRDLIQPGRLFVREGELLKVCRKQIQPRWFVLLSDALLYLKQIQTNDILYLKYELPLEDCQVELPAAARDESAAASEGCAQQVGGPDEDRERERARRELEFNVCTTVRSMTMIAKSRQERDLWYGALRDAIESHTAKRRSFKAGALSREPADAKPAGANEEALNELIGRKAPIWTPDSRVGTCQLCTSNFSALFRRHHCRACGRLVCSACSSNKAPLIYLKCKAARVCDQCFESLRANMHLYYLPACQIDERELRRLDEHFKTLLKSQFVKKRMFSGGRHKGGGATAAATTKVTLVKGPTQKTD